MRRARRRVGRLLGAVPVAVVVGLVLATATAPAGAQSVPFPAPASTDAREPSEPAAGGRRPDGSLIVNGPQRTGRPEPPLAQRVVDSLIWAWLLLALVGGTGWWLWTGRRRPAPDPGTAAGPPDTAGPAPPDDPGGPLPGSH
jgi:hypothetical protein